MPEKVKNYFSLGFESDKNGQSKRAVYLLLAVMAHVTITILAQMTCPIPVV
jgi:hypothetical protein